MTEVLEGRTQGDGDGAGGGQQEGGRHVLYIFEAGLRVNTDVYIGVLTNVVKPWMDGVTAGRPYIWQQDGAPAHMSKKTQDWCWENLPFFCEKEVWPPSSPDCNLLDYFMWGMTEIGTNCSPYNTKESLIASIKGFPREDLKKACIRFWSRLEEVIAAEGDFIR